LEFCPGAALSCLAMLLLSKMPPFAKESRLAAVAVLMPTAVPASSTRFAAGSPRWRASTMRPYEQPPPPILSASIPESRNRSSENRLDPFAESNCRAFVVELFVSVNSSMQLERSANPFPLQLILSVLFPALEKTAPAGLKYTSWREVTYGLTDGSLNCSEAIGAISAAARDDSRPAIVFYHCTFFHSRATVSVYGRAFPFRLGFFAPAPLALALVRTAGVSSWSFLRRESSIAAAAAGA